MIQLKSLYIVTLLLLAVSWYVPSMAATTTRRGLMLRHRELQQQQESPQDGGDWFGDLVDNLINGEDENEEGQGTVEEEEEDEEEEEGILDNILDGGFLDEILNGDDNEEGDDVQEEEEEEEESNDEFLDGGFFDEIFNGGNDSDTNEDGSALQDILDQIQNVTNNIIDSFNNSGSSDDLFNFTIDDLFDGNFTLDGIFNGTFINLTNIGDGSILDALFNNTDGLGNGSILDSLFNFTQGSGGILDTLFNNTNALFNETKKASVVLSPLFMEQWINDIAFDDTVCTNDDDNDVPECFNSTGSVGFWTCRTLTNPFTGTPLSQSICIGEGEYVPTIDTCGCCENNCPQVECTCPCALPSDDDDDTPTGVFVTVETIFGTSVRNCIDPRYAVSVVGRSPKITCDDSCNN